MIIKDKPVFCHILNPQNFSHSFVGNDDSGKIFFHFRQNAYEISFFMDNLTKVSPVFAFSLHIRYTVIMLWHARQPVYGSYSIVSFIKKSHLCGWRPYRASSPSPCIRKTRAYALYSCAAAAQVKKFINFEKDGDCMERFFDMDNKFFTFMGRVGDFMILNILWIICCLPIVTIGASTSALYYAALKIARNEDSYPTRMFFHSFRQNLRQGICLTLIFFIAALVLFMDIQLCRSMGGLLGQVLTGLFLLMIFVFAIILSYTFPILAQFENNLRNILRNALLMSISHLPFTLVILILNVIPVVLFLLFPYYFFLSIPAWLLFGFSVTAWINSKLFIRIFAKFIPSEEEEGDF